jgi:hypothetical protein
MHTRWVYFYRRFGFSVATANNFIRRQDGQRI